MHFSWIKVGFCLKLTYREKPDGKGLTMVASFNRFAPELPLEVAELFTPDENSIANDSLFLVLLLICQLIFARDSASRINLISLEHFEQKLLS